MNYTPENKNVTRSEGLLTAKEWNNGGGPMASMTDFLLKMLDHIESLADTRGTGAGKLKAWEQATNSYQKSLAEIYEDWSGSLASDLDDADTEDEQKAIVASALTSLSTQLTQLGHIKIVTGMVLGLGDAAPKPQTVVDIAKMMEENDYYITNSLIPDINNRLNTGLLDPDVIASGSIAILGILSALQARVESYAGAMWTAVQLGSATAAEVGTETGDTSGKVAWVLDNQAQHCDDCLEFAGEYDSFDDMMLKTSGRLPGQVQCSANCRCWVVVEDSNGDWGRP